VEEDEKEKTRGWWREEAGGWWIRDKGGGRQPF
jgi:hypothetical protein